MKYDEIDARAQHSIDGRRSYATKEDNSTGYECGHSYHVHESGVGEHGSPKWQEINRDRSLEPPSYL